MSILRRPGRRRDVNRIKGSRIAAAKLIFEEDSACERSFPTSS